MAKRILLVDDEADLRNFVGMRLEANSYDVIFAVNGEEALKKLKGPRPDLIVTDVIMPVMDGVDFYQALKKDSRLKDIPVIILTAKGQMEENFRKVRVDEFVAKPIDHKEFLAKVKKCMDESVFHRVVLIGASGGPVLESVKDQIKEAGCVVFTASDEHGFLDKAKTVGPDLILLDVLVGNKPTGGWITAVKKIPELKEIPVVIFSYIDKENLGSQPVNQKKLEVENAKTSCLNAGADKSIGEFQEETFKTNIAQFL